MSNSEHSSGSTEKQWQMWMILFLYWTLHIWSITPLGCPQKCQCGCTTPFYHYIYIDTHYKVIRFLEYNPGSIPASAHPPTPSATAKYFVFANPASSPPFCLLSGCGIIWSLFIIRTLTPTQMQMISIPSYHCTSSLIFLITHLLIKSTSSKRRVCE